MKPYAFCEKKPYTQVIQLQHPIVEHRNPLSQMLEKEAPLTPPKKNTPSK
jgi:hypothetical protein